jgi:hypothetical protein
MKLKPIFVDVDVVLFWLAVLGFEFWALYLLSHASGPWFGIFILDNEAG